MLNHMELSYCDNWREASEEKYSEDAMEVGNVEKETEAVVGEEVAITSSTTSGGARGELLGYAGGQCCPAASVFRGHLDGEEFQNQDLDNCKILCRF